MRDGHEAARATRAVRAGGCRTMTHLRSATGFAYCVERRGSEAKSKSLRAATTASRYQPPVEAIRPGASLCLFSSVRAQADQQRGTGTDRRGSRYEPSPQRGASCKGDSATSRRIGKVEVSRSWGAARVHGAHRFESRAHRLARGPRSLNSARGNREKARAIQSGPGRVGRGSKAPRLPDDTTRS